MESSLNVVVQICDGKFDRYSRKLHLQVDLAYVVASLEKNLSNSDVNIKLIKIRQFN
jgi:hypothetical protein